MRRSRFTGVGASLLVFCAFGQVLCRAVDLADRLNGFLRRLFAGTDDPI